MRGIFWIFDNGVKWESLPRKFGGKIAMHRWFSKWLKAGVFGKLMRDAGRVVEACGSYKLYECTTFSRAKGGDGGVGVTKTGKGMKFMVLVDAHGLPVVVHSASGRPHESKLVQGLFDFMPATVTPDLAIGDKAYDSDALDDQLACEGTDLIVPHRANRTRPPTQDGRVLRRYKRRLTIDRTIG